MKKIVLGQPGAFGDLLICAPIAEILSEQYEVVWPCGAEHLSTLERFRYVTPLVLPRLTLFNHGDENENTYSSRIYMGMIIADSIGAEYLNLGNRVFVNNTIADTPHPGLTVEEYKYQQADIPFETKQQLRYSRNTDKESRLYDEMVEPAEEYVFAHLLQSDGTKAVMPEKEKRKVIECVPHEGYNILDWAKVIAGAKAIYCIESSLHCLVDGRINTFKQPKYLLTTKPGHTTTVSAGWDKRYI